MHRTDADLQRLAESVTLRRNELGISRDEAARRARMSNNTWRRVEAGASTMDTTYARVDKVLDWPTGTCGRILDDPDFVPFPTATVGGARISQPPLPEDELRRAIQNATIATAPGLTGAQITELQERAIEELRSRGLLPGSDGS
jgi:transcriptional regulator with XRE-family HTH domain